MPLRNMALAYARLGSGEQGAVPAGATRASGAHRQEPLPAPRSRVIEAMLRHPDLIAGEGRPCTELMRAHPGRVVVKVGAEGVYCGLLTQEGQGIALKVEDGHTIAAALAMAAVPAELGLRPLPPALLARPP